MFGEYEIILYLCRCYQCIFITLINYYEICTRPYFLFCQERKGLLGMTWHGNILSDSCSYRELQITTKKWRKRILC